MSIPSFKTLYKISNKKIYQWSIKIEAVENNTYNIITSHGDLNGKKVIHSRNIHEGKAKKTILEQTIQEANKKWENKKDKELYVEHIDVNSTSGEPIPEKTIVVRPMLANTFSFDLYEKKSRGYKIPFPAYIQRKYDGIRCISYIKNGEVILESRKGIPFQNFNILKDQLKNLFSLLSPDFYFDGELYTEDLDFEVLNGMIRLSEKKCTVEDALLINKIQYHIYDFIDLNNLNIVYKDRYLFLHTFLKNNAKKAPLCKDVETIKVDDVSDIKKYHDEFIQSGFEGIMIRDMDGIYQINKRSKYLQKYKEFMEEEFKIIGFHEGTGDEKGCIIWECETKDKKPFNVRPNGTFESRKILFQDGSKYIGKLLTVKFQEYSADGIPRCLTGKGIRDIY